MHAVDFQNCMKGVSGANNGTPYCPNLAGLATTGLVPHYLVLVAARALQGATGAPTYGFGPHAGGKRGDPAVEEGGDWDFVPDVALRDGDKVGGNGWTFEAVHTPGHTSNHLCFALPDAGVLFSGDHVMGWSTSVIAPPDGDMAARTQI